MVNLFSEQGADIIIAGRNEREAKAIADELLKEYQTDPLGLRVGVSFPGEVKAMMK